MNRIAVATYRNGDQQLFPLRFIAKIGSHYKTERRRLKELASWCFYRGIVALDVYRMDGQIETWLIKRES